MTDPQRVQKGDERFYRTEKRTCPTCGREDFQSELGMLQHHSETHGESLTTVEITCFVCGSAKTRQRSSVHGASYRLCSDSCRAEYVGENNVGENNPRWSGGPETLECGWCEGKFRVKKSTVGRRECCSRSCASKLKMSRLDQSGKNNPNYKHGGGGEKKYYGPSWNQQQSLALKRDHHRCQRCMDTAADLGQEPDVHHIVPLHVFGVEDHETADRLSNLISLCRGCHGRVEQNFSPVAEVIEVGA